MDVYHKVLQKLYESTDGRDSQTVDFKELVKAAGFLGNYNDIFQMLSGQGWIAETPKANYVKITHWGVTEVKKTAGDAPDATQAAKKEANQMVGETKLLTILVEEFKSDVSKENFNLIEKKIGEISRIAAKLKNLV